MIFSRTLERAPWGRSDDARVVTGSASEEVARLKREPGRDMVVWGSLSLVRSLMKDDLVDEYRLWVCPLVLGDGKRLFAEGTDLRRMDWLETTPYEGGVVSLRFRPHSASS